ncbi:MAG: urate hydroxylase PuuD [Elusimicrobia bacterium]|nr:urate hydroxylase PuuD [Elusimicrobiota bacterium]
MDLSQINEWLNLIVRWFHVVAGITWIGQTYLFNWMEKTLTPPEDSRSRKNIAGELWMVHGGGFYLVEKQKVPEIMPKTLHWFKWEAALTWISGILLLIIVYYMGGLMVEPDSRVSEAAAIGIGVGVLVMGWIAYNLLWRSPLGKNEVLGATLCLFLVMGLTYELSHLLSPRAAYMHIGAMFGTIMAANVWMIILPAQTKMIAATKVGKTPDRSLAARAKRCSKHNTYMSIPLIFLMISSHFPTASYGSDYNWVILGGLILLGWGAARLMRG